MDKKAPLGLWQLIREDWERHSRSVLMPGFQGLVLHRTAAWALTQPYVLGRPVRLLCELLNRAVIRNIYGLDLARDTVIGRRLRIGHHQGVTIGAASIGDDCLVRQNLTLGHSTDEGRPNDTPTIGNRVEFGAGATVIGPVTVGDGARIGPCAVVTRDVPPGATAFAAPARVLTPINTATSA